MAKPKPVLKQEIAVGDLPRRWTLDYGVTQGHCKNPRNAKIRAITYMIDNHLQHINVEDRVTGKKVADVWYNSVWGLTISPVRSRADNVVVLPPPKRKRANRRGAVSRIREAKPKK